MSNNIVVLSGSPRKEGNTEKLAAAFIEGARSAGKNVIVFRAAVMNIGGCMGNTVTVAINGIQQTGDTLFGSASLLFGGV